MGWVRSNRKGLKNPMIRTRGNGLDQERGKWVRRRKLEFYEWSEICNYLIGPRSFLYLSTQPQNFLFCFLAFLFLFFLSLFIYFLLTEKKKKKKKQKKKHTTCYFACVLFFSLSRKLPSERETGGTLISPEFRSPFAGISIITDSELWIFCRLNIHREINDGASEFFFVWKEMVE